MAIQHRANLLGLYSSSSGGFLPSLSSVVSGSWNVFVHTRSLSNSGRPAYPQAPVQTPIVNQQQASQTVVDIYKQRQCRLRANSSQPWPAFSLPECLRATPRGTLLPKAVMFGSAGHIGLQNNLYTFRRVNFTTGKPATRVLPCPIRAYSTLRHFSYNRINRPCQWNKSQVQQRRTLFGGNSSQNLLAHMEQTANNNPQSATAQNAFYTALLRANMADIVVERYQTGRYATNPVCEATYLKALDKVGQTEGTTAVTGSKNATLNSEQIQAISQAVVAQSRGGNIAMARGKGSSAGSGAKDSPLYVVVEESIGGIIFKWAKFICYLALVCYVIFEVLTVVIETTGMIKKLGGGQNNEAKAEHQKVRFSDVHGCEEAKEELQEIVEFLKSPQKFSTLGGKLPKGVLLVGPPGTGKTLLARAIAGEAGVPFFFMSGSEFDEVYVGVGAKRVRELFSAARAKAPAIVFIDELDAIGGKRNARDAAYAKQTLNQLLTDLDGFSQASGVIFIGATNLPGLLDKALLRPGRFDRKIVVDLPDVRGRAAILKHHMRKIPGGPDVDLAVIARGTPGFSGADLENIVNQAAVRAGKLKGKAVSMRDFEWAKDRIMMGAERRSMVIQQKDKILTAYHEGGHAIVGMFTKGAMPIYKATIMPRGAALGITHFLPEMDQVSMAKLEYQARIDVSLGGKVAEELVYGPDYVTSGVSADLETATKVAQVMVTQLGMSEELGNVDLQSNYSSLSSETKQKIESEVRRIVEEGKERVTKLLSSKRKELDLLAHALVEYEMLNKDEIEKVVKGEKLPDKLTSMPTGGVPIKLPDPLLTPGMSRETKDSERDPTSSSGAEL